MKAPAQLQQQQQLAAFIHDDDDFCKASYVISARLLCGSRHSYKRVFPSLITLPVVEHSAATVTSTDSAFLPSVS